MDPISTMPTGLAAVFWGVLTFSILVVIHEGGHFLAARLFGVKVHEFMVGLPGPALRFRSKKSGVSYGVTAIPLGGYVRIAGMEPGREDPLLGRALGMLADRDRLGAAELADELTSEGVDRPHATAMLTTLEDYGAAEAIPDWPESRSLVTREAGESDESLLKRVRATVFRGQSTWKRITILAMGVLFNLASAILIFTVTLSIWGIPTVTRTIDLIQPKSAAATAGVRVGDTVEAVNGTAITSWETAHAMITASKPGDSITLTVRRADGVHVLTAVLGDSSGKALLGVRVAAKNVPMAPLAALTESLRWTGLVFVAVGQFFDPRTAAKAVGNARSVVGISYEVAAAARSGPVDYARMMGLLSLSLGVLNILPIPPLDGGKVVLEIIEGVSRRPIPRKLSYAFSAVGTLLLFSLIFYLMYADIGRYILKG
jgi:regulator of sigma E protease